MGIGERELCFVSQSSYEDIPDKVTAFSHQLLEELDFPLCLRKMLLESSDSN